MLKERIKTGLGLTLLYALVFCLSRFHEVVPHMSGLRLTGILTMPYGLLFGRTGALSAAFGAALGMFVLKGNPQLIPVECLAALLSFYLPFRIWQGMKSNREPHLYVEDVRTGTMFLILGLVGAIPLAVLPAVGGDLYHIVPFSASYLPMLLGALICTILGGLLLYNKVAVFMLEGPGEALYNKIQDTKTTTRRMAVAMLQITLMGGMVGSGLALLFPHEFDLTVVEYVMGVYSIILVIMTAI